MQSITFLIPYLESGIYIWSYLEDQSDKDVVLCGTIATQELKSTKYLQVLLSVFVSMIHGRNQLIYCIPALCRCCSAQFCFVSVLQVSYQLYCIHLSCVQFQRFLSFITSIIFSIIVICIRINILFLYVYEKLLFEFQGIKLQYTSTIIYVTKYLVQFTKPEQKHFFYFLFVNNFLFIH